MSEAKRDAAPPGWFRRQLAEIKSALNYCCAIFFLYMGGAGLIWLVLAMFKFGVEDVADLSPYVIFLAIFGGSVRIGFWSLREWRRGRAAR